MHRFVILRTIRIHPLAHEGLLWHRTFFVPSKYYPTSYLSMPFDTTSADAPSTSTVNATSEFRKIRQSLSLLESHLTTMQRAPRLPSDAPAGETRAQPQRGLLAHLNTPLSSWPTQLNPGRRADRLDIIFGYAGTFYLLFSFEIFDSLADARRSASSRSAR
jgi:hypothetical protein